MGAERKSFYIDDKVKLMTAYHEVSRGTLVTVQQRSQFIVIGRPRAGCSVYRWCNAPTQGNLRSSWTRARGCKCLSSPTRSGLLKD